MTRLPRSLAMVSVLVLAVGCGNKNKDNQTDNPDQSVDGAEGDASEGGEDTASSSSRARASTATRGSGRNTKARKVTAAKPPRSPADESGDSGEGGEAVDGPNGLMAEAFPLADPAAGLPEDLSTLGEASESFFVPNLDYDEIEFDSGFPGSNELKENYAIRFSGSINVVEEAEYELCLHSDDGSQLLLEGMMVIDNNGIHDGAVEACELLYLAPGEYMLEIGYMQATGPMLTMHFAWSMNGGDKVIVPSEVLFKPLDPAADPSGSR